MGSSYAWACGLGAVLIAWFSWDQLNRPTDEGARKLARLYDLLTPEELSGRGTFARAYLVYLAILLLIYAVLCAAATFGLAIGPLQEFFGAADKPKPEAPLMVAAAMVGLLPNSRSSWFTATERRLRVLAHSAVGIPGALIAIKTRLERASLDLSDLPPEVIEPVERRRLEERLRCAEFALEPGAFAFAQLRRALVKSAAFRAWVFQQKVWPDPIHRAQYVRLEETVSKALAALELELDMLVSATRHIERGPEKAGEVATLLGLEPRGDAASVEAWRTGLANRWQAVAQLADATVGDVCALLAVYVARQPLPCDSDPAAAALSRFLSRAAEEEGPQDFDRRLVVLAGMAVVAVAFVGGGIDAFLSVEHDTILGNGFEWAFTAVVNYLPAMVIAALMHDTGSGAKAGSIPISRYLLIVATAGFTALILLALLNLSKAALVWGLAPVQEHFSEAVRFALQSEASRALRGAGMAFAVLLALDFGHRDSDERTARRWRLAAPLILGGLFALSAAAFEYDSFQTRLNQWEFDRDKFINEEAESAAVEYDNRNLVGEAADSREYVSGRANAVQTARKDGEKQFDAKHDRPEVDLPRALFATVLTAGIGLASGLALFRAARPADDTKESSRRVSSIRLAA